MTNDGRIASTLEYRINRGVRIIGGSEMVRYNNNRGVGIIGGVLGEIENSLFLRQTRICYVFM